MEKPRTRGKDKKPRKTDGYKKSCQKARENSPITQAQKMEMPEGYNRKRILFMQEILPTEPLDYDDVEEMERRFRNYLQKCAEWDMKVGNMAAYAAIGINKDLVCNWLHTLKGHEARKSFVKKVQNICAMYREGLMEDGKVNPVTGIFWQKNYDGLKDQQEMVLTPNTDPLGEQKDPEALKQKYLDSTYGVTELPDKAESKIPELPQKEPETIE